MSRQVMISYDSLTIKVKAQCETAAHSLCAIDKVLNRIHETANRLETVKVKEYELYLNKTKDEIIKEINIFKSYLESLKNRSDYDYKYNEVEFKVKQKAQELNNFINELTGEKLAVIDQMINDGLLNASNSSTQKMLNKMHGIISCNEKILQKINEIDDISLRELAYRELNKAENDCATYEEIISKAKKEYDILIDKKSSQVISEYKNELEANGVNSSILDKVSTIQEAKKITNEAIIDEKIRKETIKVIIKAIKERGFIVDTKNNLKIDSKNNIVKLVALKASGQIAEFEIQLNGKFMYHFDGYEGFACNKDIEPFIEDLKKVYDINILNEEIQWSNPDKISTQKYQYVNKNKGKN